MGLQTKEECFNGAAVFQPRKCGWHCWFGWVASWLQWGRGLSTAEIREFDAPQVLQAMLQWGRGLSTAEMSGPAA